MSRNVIAMADALSLAEHYQGIRYLWAGKTPQGFDCSGLCCELLMSVGILPDRTVLSSRGLYRRFSDNALENALPCALIFYGRSVPKISHVAMAIDDEFIYEAGGGTSRTQSIMDAIRHRAFVRRRRIDRRSDLVAICDPFQN
jgi:cell wall-associated NlpC family hydrolase